MKWLERLHPRGRGGKFASGGGDWVDRVSDSIDRQRGPKHNDLIAAGTGESLAADAHRAASAYPDVDGDVLPRRRRVNPGGMGPHGEEALHHIAAHQGFEAHPETVTREEMNRRVGAGDIELFRGLTGNNQVTAGQMHERYRTGEAYHGLGYTGNGTYMTNQRHMASSYGQPARYALRRDARVVDFRALQLEQDEYLRGLEHGSITHDIYSDPGRYAAARGYDAIRWMRGAESGRPGMEEWVILNRGAMLAEAP